jgi:CSLREA domain-containing protein
MRALDLARGRRKRASGALAVLVVLVGAAPATAATIAVNTTQDETTQGDGLCSLREAIAAVNTPGSVGDCTEADGVSNTIVLEPGGYDLTIKPTGSDDGTTGDLHVVGTVPLTIKGAGVGLTTISATALADRVLAVGPVATLTIEDLTITGGQAPDGARGTDAVNQTFTPPTAGGAGQPGGGVLNHGSLTLKRVALTDNAAGSGGAGGVGLTDAGQGALGGNGGAGGAIDNTGMLTLTDVTVSGDVAGTGGTGGAGGEGGVAGQGGGGGCCGDGGGLENDGGTVKITGSTFSGNHAGVGGPGGTGGSGIDIGTAGPGGTGAGGSSGGAIATNGGTVTITNSTLSGNFGGPGGSGGSGGGGDNFDSPAPNGGSSGNGSAGGAVFAHGGATVTVTNVTVVANQVGGPGAPGSPGDSKAHGGSTGNPAFGGGVDESAASVTLANTLLASNELGNCAGAVTDGGHNLSFSFSQCPQTFLSGDPKLGPLQDNGGPTQTEALGAGSAAVDQVPGTGAGCPSTDQRGLSRPSGTACDIGAYEVTPPAVSTGLTTAITTTGATLSGSVIPNSPSGQARFEYGTTTAYGSTAQAPALTGDILTSQPVTASVTGLNPGTTYHFRIVASSQDGTTEGPDETFTTSPQQQQPPPPKSPPPRLRNLKFHPARGHKSVSISYTDSRAATTTFAVFSINNGVKHGKRCVRESNHAHGPRCTIVVERESFTHPDSAGRNQFTFNERVAAKRLKPGSYLLVATPRVGQLRGASLSVRFRIASPPAHRRR